MDGTERVLYRHRVEGGNTAVADCERCGWPMYDGDTYRSWDPDGGSVFCGAVCAEMALDVLVGEMDR